MSDTVNPSWRDEFLRARLEAGDPPDQQQLTRAVSAALAGTVDPAAVAAFVREAALAPQTCMLALRDAVKGGSEASQRVLEIVREALPLLEAALAAASSAEERAQVRDQLLALIAEARLESSEQRTFLLRIGQVAAVVAVATLGAVAYLLSGGNAGRARPGT